MTKDRSESASGAPAKLTWPLRAAEPRLNDEARVRLWNQLAVRLEAVRPAAGLRAGAPPQRRPRLLAAGAVFAIGAAALLLVLLSGRSSALYTQDGQAFQEMRVAAGAASSRVTFEGGVQLEASGGTLVTNLVANEQDVVLQLASGKLQLSIPPGGKRRWSIEAGVASVEVVGTVLSVARGADSVEVSVSRGAVLVRSPFLAERVARVAAGSTLSVARPRPTAQAPQPATGELNDERAQDPTGELGLESDALAPQTLPLAPTAPLPRLSADALLQRADAARLGGEFTRAETLLNRFLTQYPSDARSASVVFTLGVVQVRAGRSPSIAVGTFRRALALASAASLREDCYQRLIEALLAAGDRSAAEATLGRYEAEFAAGRHRVRLQRLLRAGATP